MCCTTADNSARTETEVKIEVFQVTLPFLLSFQVRLMVFFLVPKDWWFSPVYSDAIKGETDVSLKTFTYDSSPNVTMADQMREVKFLSETSVCLPVQD